MRPAPPLLILNRSYQPLKVIRLGAEGFAKLASISNAKDGMDRSAMEIPKALADRQGLGFSAGGIPPKERENRALLCPLAI